MFLFLSLSFALADDAKKRPTDLERGEELYVRHCLACHGATARGDGPLASAMVTPMKNLQGKARPTKPLQQLVLRGKGAMPGFEASFDREDARRTLLYMSRLKGVKPVKPSPMKKPPAPAQADKKAPAKPAGE